MKLPCEASFEFQELKRWQWCFRARFPSNSNRSKKWTHLFNAAVPIYKISNHMQNTIAQHYQEEERSRETISSTARAVREHFIAKWRRLRLLRKRANFSPPRKLRLPEKTQCFVQVLKFKSQPRFMKMKLSCKESWEAKDLKITPSWEACFEFQEVKNWKQKFHRKHPSNSSLLYSYPLYLTQLDSTLPNTTQLDLKFF